MIFKFFFLTDLDQGQEVGEDHQALGINTEGNRRFQLGINIEDPHSVHLVLEISMEGEKHQKGFVQDQGLLPPDQLVLDHL